jgi:hypothetical protein
LPWAEQLCSIRPSLPWCSVSLQVHSDRAKWSWTEASETTCQNKSLKLFNLRYFISVMKNWLSEKIGTETWGCHCDYWSVAPKGS